MVNRLIAQPLHFLICRLQTMHETEHEARVRTCFEQARWPAGVVCPHCSAQRSAVRLRVPRMGLYKCRTCRKQFTVTVGTPLEHTRLPLTKWLEAIRLFCGSRTKPPATALATGIGVNYRTALLIVGRLRDALGEESFRKWSPACLEDALVQVLRAGPLKPYDYLERLDRAEKALAARRAQAR